jgi:F-type H+-transporting ATPase subunit delta
MKKCMLTVASTMTESTFDYLCEKAKSKVEKDTEIVKIVDDSVIAGFIMEYDGTVYDCSVGTQLKQLKKHLSSDGGDR